MSEQTNQTTHIEAYPLQWPVERKRTPAHQRTRSPFCRRVDFNYADGTKAGWKRKEKLTIADSRDRVMHEVKLLGGKSTVISSNLRLRLDGLPVSQQREPEDPGVAVYFRLEGQPRCVSCDKWDRAADNLAAIAKFIEAMRGQLRWGVGDVSAIFAGFKALPASAAGTSAGVSTVEEAAAFLVRFGGGVTDQEILTDRWTYKRTWNTAAMQLHPDRNKGETPPEWHKLQAAKELLDRRHR